MTDNNLQPNYNRYAPTAQNGTPASMTGWDTDTRILESATAGFGKAMSQGAADRGAVLGVPSGHNFVGISLADITLDQSLRDTPDTYVETENMGVAIEGDIWVIAADTVTPTSAVSFVRSTGAGWGDGDAVLDGARFMTSGDEDDLVVVRLNGDMSVSDV